jgi:acyl carrier protein
MNNDTDLDRHFEMLDSVHGLSSHDKNKKGDEKMDDLKDVILEYVIEEYGDEDDKITCETPLISGGLVDSFSLVSLKRFLEVKYKISIPDEDASPEAFDSVNKIADLVSHFIT